MKKRFQIFFSLALCILLAASCQKMKRPALGDYPLDANPPGGPLKFYAAFDGTTANPLFNAVDSIRANFAAVNALTSINGISGKAIQGAFDKAIRYASANDFAKSTSFTIAFWLKATPWAGGPGFILSLTNKDYWHNSAIFLLIEDQGLSSASQATLKFAVMDQWFEFKDEPQNGYVDEKFKKPLLDGNWHHLVFVYDETTSKMTYYFDGAVYTLATTRQTDVKNGGNPRGPLKLTDASGLGGSLVFGGWNKQVGIDGPGDSWIQGFNGGLDQLRLYGKALTASEVLALYNSRL
jgi:hypothetical protein